MPLINPHSVMLFKFLWSLAFYNFYRVLPYLWSLAISICAVLTFQSLKSCAFSVPKVSLPFQSLWSLVFSFL